MQIVSDNADMSKKYLHETMTYVLQNKIKIDNRLISHNLFQFQKKIISNGWYLRLAYFEKQLSNKLEVDKHFL